MDASKKEAGCADFFTPTGDVDGDMKKIREFYAEKKGLRAENS